MDSQLASVLDVQNGSQCAEGSGPVTKMFVDPGDKVQLPAAPGNPQPPVRAALTIRAEAPLVNGQQPEGGGTSQPTSQEPSKIGGLRQPITVKTGVPVLRNQPIRIKIVVPPRYKGPITHSAISLTKDFTLSHPTEAGVLPDKSRRNTHTSAVTSQGGIMEAKDEGDPEAEILLETEGDKGREVGQGKDVLDVKIVHINESESHTIPRTNTVKILTQRRIQEESTESQIRKNLPLILQEMGLIPRNTLGQEGMEEQTEPLDLSLPNKRGNQERRCGLFQDDSGCEGLIMEVDEYEGEGDRDVVEEDEDDTMDLSALPCVDGSELLDDSLLSPSHSTSVFTSLSAVDCDNKHLLLIDDQGIPYTLSHDGQKLPQVNISPSSPQSGRAGTPETEGTEESHEVTSTCLGFSQSSDAALKAPSSDPHPSPTPASDSSTPSIDQTSTPGVQGVTTNPEPSVEVEPGSSVPQAVFPSSSLISTSTQPLQMLPNPSINVPFLFLSPSSTSPQLCSAPVSLPLSLSIPQASPGASTPMFLLVSSVPSSSGESTSTSTPIAVLNPSTGQVSQITAASAPISLPLSSGQVAALGPHVPALSNPVITLSANNPSVRLSGTGTINSNCVLSVPSPVHAQGSAPLTQTHICYSEPNPGNEAILVKDVSHEVNKQSTVPASSAQGQTSSVTYDPSAQPNSETSAQTPAIESNATPSDHLPLDDHLYFSNPAAPPSPSIAPMFPSGNLDPIDPLDPISPSGSPDSMSSRRVLYCPLCPRVFFYLSDLERHAITHSQKKPHVCQQCGKAFKRSSHLQRHKHIHTGQRNFVCPICAKRFREAGELQRHQRVHTGEKPYQCQLCHTRFAERNTLRRHTKRKHPYHQAAMEMLSERRDRGGGRRDDGEVGGSVAQEEEESAEWYSSTVSNLEHSESEMEN